jgi:hypothetical protein
VAVSADGRGLVSQAGAVLLWETMRVTGLGRGLPEGLARWRAPRAVHDPGKIIADLAAAVALGGDCLADIAVLREQPGLAGPVASDPLVSRLVTALAADGPRALKAVRAARAAARERAWALAGKNAPGSDGGLVTVDLDATIVIAHSDKDQASPTWKNSLNNQRVLESSGVVAGQNSCMNTQGPVGLVYTVATTRRQVNRSALCVRFRGAEAEVTDPRHADRDISDRGMTRRQGGSAS